MEDTAVPGPTTEAIAELGSLIRAKRRELGLSQDELGSLVGLNREYVSQIERGQVTTHLARLVGLLHQLGFDLRAVPRRRPPAR